MTLGNWLYNAITRDSHPALEYKDDGQWKSISWKDYVNCVISSYEYLKKLGLQKKNHVGIMCSTRWEWAALDLAVLGSGNITVPMYPNLSDDELLYIANHSEVTILVYETAAHADQLQRIQQNFERQIQLVALKDIEFHSLITEDKRDHFFNISRNLDPKSIATIVYTSGTTGRPKGAVLNHESIVSEVTEAFLLFGVKPYYKCLTFLPFAHVLGRIEHWGSCWNGHTIAYAESIEKIKSNLNETKPDFIIAVPRIFEKIYSGIMTQLETSKYKQSIFNLALETSQEIQKYRKTRETIPWSLLLKYEGLSRIAFAPLLEAFGGKLKFAVSGGAPISAQLVEFFTCCGIPLLEGYGLTETCAAITVNSLNNYQAGTVGRPIGDVEIKFAEDGEILVKSKKCLQEYYKEPEETQKCIRDGYFYTGDIGEFTDRGYLKITDRKKDLIKTAGGKYVAPQKLEGLLKQDHIISQVLIHGDQKKFISALITLDPAHVAKWAESQQITYDKVADLYNNPLLKSRLQKHIQSLNSSLSTYESIKKFEIVYDEWTVENGSLTQSLKVKRKFLESKYADLISEIYD